MEISEATTRHPLHEFIPEKIESDCELHAGEALLLCGEGSPAGELNLLKEKDAPKHFLPVSKLFSKKKGSSSRKIGILVLKVEKITCPQLVLRLLISSNKSNNISSGKQLHALIFKSGHFSHPSIAGSLAHMYSKSGHFKESRSVFDAVRSKEQLLWNVMISSHPSNGRVDDAYKMFNEMRLQGLSGDGFSFSALLTSCSSSLGSLVLGQQTHGLLVTMGLLRVDVVVDSSLVNMYAKCGAIHSARKMFDEMLVRNVVSWNTIIVGYGHCGHGEEAVKLLPEMIRGISKPDELTVSTVLSSCASSAASIESKQIHGFALKNGLHAFVSVGNALIISYAKSGSISDAYKCFCSVSEPNLITWTSMIRSFAFHGLSAKAVDLFERMLRGGGGKPDSVAFLGVLSACGHAGLVETGLAYFESMVKEYQIDPCPEHYTCVVDLLARAGNVSEAYNVLSQMPFEPNADVLRAFLGGCRVHGEAAMAEWAAAKLFSVEPGEPVNYKSMSSVYASCQFWEGAASVRRTMMEKCSKKVAGCCWVEINGRLRTFVANDESHPEVLEIYPTLNRIMKLMKEF